MEQINASTRTTILLCLGALILASVLGIYTSRWIAKPILQLREASVAIASGKLEQTIKIHGINKLESLAQAFNQIARQLKDSFTNLYSLIANYLQIDSVYEENTNQTTQSKFTEDNTATIITPLVVLNQTLHINLLLTTQVLWLKPLHFKIFVNSYNN